MKKTQSTQKKTTKKDKEFRLDKKYVKELAKLGVEVRYSPTCPGAFLYYGAVPVGSAFDWSFGKNKIGWQVKSNKCIRLVVTKDYEITDDGKLKETIKPEFVETGCIGNFDDFEEVKGQIASFIVALTELTEIKNKELKRKK